MLHSSKPHSYEKLFYWSRVLQEFARLTKNSWAGKRVCINLFAGCGSYRDIERNELGWGSPLLALHAIDPFDPRRVEPLACASRGAPNRNLILMRDGGGFIRLTDFVRTTLIGPKTTHDWLSSKAGRYVRTTSAFSTRRLHQGLYTYGALAISQVDPKRKVPIRGPFAEPSSGLEPSTLSLYEGGRACQVGGGSVAWSWCSWGFRVSSWAHLSIASYGEDKAGWEARSGSASPYGAVMRPWGLWRLPERRGGRG
jgi:hypothetical protein